MPDLDIVQRRLLRHWRAPYRLTKGNHPAESVAAALVTAVAATLRDEGGIPAFESLCAASRGMSASVSGTKTLAEVSRAIEQEFGQQRAVKLAARAAQRNALEIHYGRALPGPLSLAKEYLRQLLDHHFFSKAITPLIGEGKRFSDTQEARQFESSVRSYAEPKLTEIAKRLSVDPTASRLRAPKSPRHHRTTAELLEEPLA
jgi:hypothetical protein